MTNTMKPIYLTAVEIRHLLDLIEVNERDEWYRGSREPYWKRSLRIKVELKNALFPARVEDGGQ